MNEPKNKPGPCPRCKKEMWKWQGGYYTCENPECIEAENEYLVEVDKYTSTEVKVRAKDMEEAEERAIKICKHEPGWWTDAPVDYDARVLQKLG